jgi:BASS family bile acid:Na+ symporter
VIALALLIGLNLRAMLDTFGSGAAAVGSLFVALSLGVGYVLGGPELGTRSVLAVGTGQRNVAAALLIATQNFAEEPGVVAMLLVTTLAGLVVLVVAARHFAGRAESASGSATVIAEGIQ